MNDEEKLAEELALVTDQLMAGEKSLDDIDDDALREMAATVHKIQKTIGTPKPSQTFASRLKKQVLSELPDSKAGISEMMQNVIARLLGDEEFRNSFFSAPEATIQRAGFQLSSVEMAALKEMEPEDMGEWFTDLDERISKSGLGF